MTNAGAATASGPASAWPRAARGPRPTTPSTTPSRRIITGAGTHSTAAGNGLLIQAQDGSSIIADGGGSSLSVAAGSTGGAAGALGEALALNGIGNSVLATVDGARSSPAETWTSSPATTRPSTP